MRGRVEEGARRKRITMWQTENEKRRRWGEKHKGGRGRKKSSLGRGDTR